MVDFLFVHPRISGKIEPVRGTGIRILQGICCIASISGCRRVWGEATRDSAPFYQQRLHRTITDSFFLSPKETAAEDVFTGVPGNRHSVYLPKPKPARRAASTAKQPSAARPAPPWRSGKAKTAAR